jgi:spermidine synthase
LILSGALAGRSRVAALVTVAVAIVLVATSPPWDRELLASGVYMYAPYVPKDLDLETQLKAGDLLYYEEGAAATVSVKKLTGTTTLAVDGKTDASNRGDMLTQKLIAHLPLLLHRNPKDVFIIGLGSGMTAGAALTHPIARADVIEISPEVVKASEHFKIENRNALADPRTNLIVGDGRSHLALSQRQYDVIVSEPSNPWIAGVSSLFTREFFESARARLAPGGIICQWANAYNISASDLKSIVATFTSVFPNGTVWLVGGDDVLMLASSEPIDGSLTRLAANMKQPDVASDLASLGIVDPFSILSLYIGGPEQLRSYAAGAPLFDDDRMTLEFTAPRELHKRRAGENGATLTRLLQDAGPEVIRQARTAAGAAEWRHRGDMHRKADVYQRAYDDYLQALAKDPGDAGALDGLVRTALITKQAAEAAAILKKTDVKTPDRAVAISKLLAAAGNRDEALALAREAAAQPPRYPGLEQLASLFADSGDTVQLDATVEELRAVAPERAATEFYAAVAAFLHGDANEAVARAERAIAIDPAYAASYDLIGAAYTRIGRLDPARQAFQKSLSFDAHDSTAYENLGVLELNAGNRALAAKYFAEALWLVPDSQTARQGLAQSRP